MGLAKELKYKDGGLIPAIVQDEQGKILMVAYMNEEAVTYTEEKKVATFWSRSRGKLWKKGEESGNILEVLAIRVDCDEYCLVLTCRPRLPYRLLHLFLPTLGERAVGDGGRADEGPEGDVQKAVTVPPVCPLARGSWRERATHSVG